MAPTLHGDDGAVLSPSEEHAAAAASNTDQHKESGNATPCLPKQRKPRDVVLMYSKPYLDALQLLPVHSQRELMTLALVRALGLMGTTSRLQCVAPTQTTRADLELFHGREYIDALIKHDADSTTTATAQVKETDEQELERFGLVDDAYVFPGVWQYCRYVAGASVTAADALLHLMRKRTNSSNTMGNDSKTLLCAAPVVINLGGGRHHAMRSKASGFCYVNDIVLGIQRLLTRGVPTAVNNVLCVDIDVHHGDGTQEAFYFSDSVTTVSFHLHERGFFPGTGAMGSVERSVNRGKFRNINVPLKRGISDAAYTALFDTVVGHAVEQLKPQVVVLVCGVDTLSRYAIMTGGGSWFVAVAWADIPGNTSV